MRVGCTVFLALQMDKLIYNIKHGEKKDIVVKVGHFAYQSTHIFVNVTVRKPYPRRCRFWPSLSRR